jgi:Flp pilus assembly protein TadG
MIIKSPFARFARSNSGMAAAEFAMVAPILLTMFLGSYGLMDGIGASRKVTVTTRAIADLTSQFTSVSDSDLDSVLAASRQIMSPYPVGQGKYRVSLITVDAGSNAKVAWSRSLNGEPLVTGATFNLPANLKKAGMSLLIADVDYGYLSPSGFMGTISLKDKIYMLPRGSGTITKKAAT